MGIRSAPTRSRLPRPSGRSCHNRRDRLRSWLQALLRPRHKRGSTIADAAAVHLTEEIALAEREDGSTSFAELVWAHYLWERELHTNGSARRESEARYRRALAEFESRHGEIVSCHWSISDASAVALTCKQGWGPLRLLGKEPTFRLHRVTDWVLGQETAPLADVLHRCDTLAIRAAEVLRGASERIAMQLILAVAADVLGLIDRCEGKPTEETARAEARAKRKELDRIEAYYDLAANKHARIVYTGGMFLGLLWLLLAVPVLALVLDLFGAFDGDTRTEAYTLLACYGAGALGALVSVMSRMASPKGKFSLDYEVGRKAIRRLGMVRPVLGATFGIAAFLVVKSGSLQLDLDENRFYLLTTAAFLAGFSERWTKVLLHGAEERLSGGAAEQDDSPPPAKGEA